MMQKHGNTFFPGDRVVVGNKDEKVAAFLQGELVAVDPATGTARIKVASPHGPFEHTVSLDDLEKASE